MDADWTPQAGVTDTDTVEVIVTAEKLERRIHPPTWATIADQLDTATHAQLMELMHGGLGDV